MLHFPCLPILPGIIKKRNEKNQNSLVNLIPALHYNVNTNMAAIMETAF